MGAYELSLILLSAIGFGLYLNGLVRLSRERKAALRKADEPIKPQSRAAGA